MVIFKHSDSTFTFFGRSHKTRLSKKLEILKIDKINTKTVKKFTIKDGHLERL